MTIRSTIIASALALSAVVQPLHAGGPVLIEDAFEAEAPQKLRPGDKIALAVLGLVVLGLIAGGGNGGSDLCNGDDPAPTPEPC